MDIGIPPKVAFPTIRTPSPIEDGDVGHKGNYYRRRAKKNKLETPEPPRSGEQESPGSIDIRV